MLKLCNNVLVSSEIFMPFYGLRCPGCACMQASNFPFLLMKKDIILHENQVWVETDANHWETMC